MGFVHRGPMARGFDGVFDRFLHRRALRRWSDMAGAARAMDLATLRQAMTRAWSLRRRLDSVIHEGAHRLALPVIGSNAIRRPLGTDWAWRGPLWHGPIPVPGLSSVPGRAEIAPGATLFHDCRRSELTIRQIRNTRESDLAPFGVRLDVFRFDGSFLSLAIDLPPAAVEGLRQTHIIRVDAIVEMEKPLEIFARLNVRHGPNSEQAVRELPLAAEEVMVEFDLAYLRINDKRVEKIWLDLIFEGPEMNQVILRDVTVTRRPRAAL